MAEFEWIAAHSLQLALKMDLYQRMHQIFRCCLHCGSFQSGHSQFCQLCENDLWRAHSEPQVFQVGDSPLQGIALFDWYPDQDRKVSKLMLSLKGGRLQQTFEFYARALVGGMREKPHPESILIPCPSAKQRMHSQSLTRALSEILEIPYRDCLIKIGSEKQKSKDKRGREAVQITTTVDFSKQYVIFIDDIVTTGSTALAAYKAIGPCAGFEVWCLAHRRQLAAYSGV